jgi:hypothetical protein
VETLARFAPTANPRLPVGPPFIENVPTSIHWAGEQLVVTLLSGAPFFLPGYSQVQQVDPDTGAISPMINGLSSAIDTIALRADDGDAAFLTLEHNLTFPVPGPGRIQFFPTANASPIVLSGCLTTPTSMAIDRKSSRVVISELASGRLMTLELR